MHTRRTYLAGAALLPLAGCLSVAPGDTPTGTETLPDGGNDSDETRPRGIGGPAVTLAGVDDQPALPLPVAEHRFETTITRFADPEDLGAGQEAVDWGFTVLLE